MSFLPLRGGPGGTVEVGVLVLRLDAGPEPIHGGRICNVRTLQAFFRSPTVEEANHATKSVNDEGARVSLGRENAGALVIIIDSEFFGLLFGVVVANKRLHACRTSDGEVGSVTVFEDDEAGLVVVVALVRFDQELFRDDAVDPKLAILRILEDRAAVAARVHHLSKLEDTYLGP